MLAARQNNCFTSVRLNSQIAWGEKAGSHKMCSDRTISPVLQARLTAKHALQFWNGLWPIHVCSVQGHAVAHHNKPASTEWMPPKQKPQQCEQNHTNWKENILSNISNIATISSHWFLFPHFCTFPPLLPTPTLPPFRANLPTPTPFSSSWAQWLRQHARDASYLEHWSWCSLHPSVSTA